MHNEEPSDILEDIMAGCYDSEEEDDGPMTVHIVDNSLSGSGSPVVDMASSTECTDTKLCAFVMGEEIAELSDDVQENVAPVSPASSPIHTNTTATTLSPVSSSSESLFSLAMLEGGCQLETHQESTSPDRSYTEKQHGRDYNKDNNHHDDDRQSYRKDYRGSESYNDSRRYSPREERAYSTGEYREERRDHSRSYRSYDDNRRQSTPYSSYDRRRDYSSPPRESDRGRRVTSSYNDYDIQRNQHRQTGWDRREEVTPPTTVYPVYSGRTTPRSDIVDCESQSDNRPNNISQTYEPTPPATTILIPGHRLPSPASFTPLNSPMSESTAPPLPEKTTPPVPMDKMLFHSRFGIRKPTDMPPGSLAGGRVTQHQPKDNGGYGNRGRGKPRPRGNKFNSRR